MILKKVLMLSYFLYVDVPDLGPRSLAYAYLFLYVYFVVLKLTVDSYLYYQKLKNVVGIIIIR